MAVSRGKRNRLSPRVELAIQTQAEIPRLRTAGFESADRASGLRQAACTRQPVADRMSRSGAV